MQHIPESAKVSVVLATYNGEKFIREQLNSILAQSIRPYEIIIMDDASLDGTKEILTAYAVQYPYIKLYFNKVNLGYIKNFEKALTLASGNYIALCDQDDYWLPQKLEKLLMHIGDHTMVYSDSLLCDENLQSNGKKISDVAVCQPYTSCLQQAVFCRIYGHATLFSKRLLTKAIPFPEVLPHDWWLSFMATLDEGIAYFPEVLVYYRQHSNNVFGAVGGKSKKEDKKLRLEKKQLALVHIRERMQLFYNACPNNRPLEKSVLRALNNSYQNFGLRNNLLRVILFFRYQQQLLVVKKRSGFRKILFCFKMFVMIK
jgi:glycosyltransferase involved in cell wall biosynthesis